ncbi:peptidylprolyl isomerase [Nakamurella flavida]|uniref:FKBP-type peptidyl-prolyl cis-trans isomerase n=1 Tax=Nakamurella flavida TaxID=363630 RepID=UPI002789BE15|nr:FKBP-type peptidyl-prolyl cis-trans isomerase [Nakamurella flavida]MDP9780146.1 peptidylprolyl isomerase [Nakamurella flavida]
MRVRAVVAVLPLVVLGACASGTSSVETSATTSTAASSSGPVTDANGSTVPSSEAATLGPEVPAATVVAAAVPADQLPTATGAFGEKPTLTFPADPPPSLQRQILTEGTGPEVAAGDWLVTNYLGQVWNGTVFDNSYDRNATSAFQIGVGKVVPGWDVGLTGVKVGSRVLLSLPPADGYGSTGQASAGITGTDTLVFVIDVVQAIGPNQGGQTDATPQPAPANAPEVTGDLGVKPTLTIPAGLAEPTAASTTVLATGTGPAVTDGSVLAQYVAVSWDGQPIGATWPDASADPTTQVGAGPQQIQIAAGSPFEGLVGVPVGSRVLVQLPAAAASATSGGQATPAIAAVLDIVAQTG